MLTTTLLSMDAVLTALKAAGEETRLRILHLLADSELTVKDLTTLLAQAQPRNSRHLKLLAEAGLVVRHPEGARVYYRLADEAAARRLVRALTDVADGADPTVGRDRERLQAVKDAHAKTAARYFAVNAGDWDVIRSLHVPELAVETAMREAVGTRPFGSFLDLGTGTGRLLELFAPLYQRGVGVDLSTAMLAVARTNLSRAGVGHAQIRQGDIYNLNLPRDSFDLVTIHQVLHYLDDPARAIAEAARVLRPGGRLLVVDFAPHELEFLRERHAHRRLGFDRSSIAGWLADAGLRAEKVRDLRPDKGVGDKLTVSLWLAEDPRMLVADTAAAQKERVA